MPTAAHVAQIQPFLPILDNQWKTWKEQFASYLIATGLDKAPKEKQLAIFLQRFGTDRPRILPTHTGNDSKQPLPLKRSCPLTTPGAHEKKATFSKRGTFQTSFKDLLGSCEKNSTALINIRKKNIKTKAE